jgi:hypothetical protein
MKTITPQHDLPGMKRKLKIEDFRADYRAKPASIIRLKGQWLRAAGFHPGATIELHAISPGVIEIRVCGPAGLTGESFSVMGPERCAETAATMLPKCGTGYQPKTGQACHCKPGPMRDNCARCEGTGQVIDFAAIRNARRSWAKKAQVQP